LAAGRGKRLLPITQDIPKALIYIAGRTLLQWSIKRLSDAGCTDIFIGTGWKGEMISNAVAEQSVGTTTKIRSVPVPTYANGPLQTFCDTSMEVHGAINVLLPVDLIISAQDVKSIISVHPKNEHYAVTLAIDFSSVTGSDVSLSEDGHILAINKDISKVDRKAKSAMLLVFSPGFLDYCTFFLHRGEDKIFKVLNEMVWMIPQFNRACPPVHPYTVKTEWFDIDSVSDILKANQYLLANLTGESPLGIYVPPDDTMEFGDSITLGNNISIGSGVELIGPCLIQANSTIAENCIIGPNVSLDEHSQIGPNSKVNDAVVFGASSISENQQLSHAVIFKSKIIREEL
jgi:NDP-sugar pyrophosphorylase family protein